ncbi:MAG: anti-sigma factor family protein [Planctomycetaceae bacterium]
MEKRLSRLTTEQRYELVAYLDGELDDAATARIEKLLAENEVARKEVEVLAATYALFDQLPRPKAQSGFTEKTLAMAKLENVRPDVSQSPLLRRIQRAIPYLAWIAAMCVAGMIGFAITRLFVPAPNAPLVQDLELIQEFEKYAEVGSVDFLQRLRNSEELLREIRGANGADTAQ